MHEVLARVAPADGRCDRVRVLGRRTLDSVAGTAAQPLWDVPEPADPVEKLAAFENGASIAWNEALHKYVALVNTSFAPIGARTADRLEGPWSDAQPWLDCLTFAQMRVPDVLQPVAARRAGRTTAAAASSSTVSSLEPYATAAFELRPGVAIHEWRGAQDAVAYAAASPGSGWSDQGIAFYASATPSTASPPIYRWQRGDESRYAAASPGDGFERGEWRSTRRLRRRRIVGDVSAGVRLAQGHVAPAVAEGAGLEQYGYTRGEPAFYAPERGIELAERQVRKGDAMNRKIVVFVVGLLALGALEFGLLGRERIRLVGGSGDSCPRWPNAATCRRHLNAGDVHPPHPHRRRIRAQSGCAISPPDSSPPCSSLATSIELNRPNLPPSSATAPAPRRLTSTVRDQPRQRRLMMGRPCSSRSSTARHRPTSRSRRTARRRPPSSSTPTRTRTSRT